RWAALFCGRHCGGLPAGREWWSGLSSSYSNGDSMSVGCECAMVDRRIPKCVTDPVTKATDTSTTLGYIEKHTCRGGRPDAENRGGEMADAVIVAGARTPFGRLQGELSKLSAVELGGRAI